MKGKLAVAVVVVLAAILIASPVLAAGSSNPMQAANPSPKQQPTVISMTATILSVDTGKATIYVKIQMTNKAFIQYRGTEQLVKTNSATKYILWVNGTPSGIAIDFSDLAVGNKVSINAKVDPATKAFTARRIQLNQPRIP